MHIPQKVFCPEAGKNFCGLPPGQSFPVVAVMPHAAKVLKQVMVNTGGNKEQVPAKRQNRGSRNSTATVFSQENYVMFEHSIFRRNFL